MQFKTGISTLAFAALSLSPLLSVPGVAASTVDGNVFVDYNANGLGDSSARGADQNLAGVTVTLYDALNTVVGTDTTGDDGNYAINTPEAGPFRIEFTDLPEGLVSSSAGRDNGSTVQFVAGSGTANLALTDTDEFCANNGYILTSCYLGGDVEGDALVRFPYSFAGSLNGFGGQPNPGLDEAGEDWISRDDSYMPTPVSMNSQIGTVYGLAFASESDTLYTGSFVRRKSKLGGLSGESTGAIYQTNNLLGSNPTSDVLVDLNQVFGADTAGVNPHPAASTNFDDDEATVPVVGKVGLGDLEISSDQSTLYTVNLANNNLYTIPVANPTTATATAIPAIPGCEVDTRPFALGLDASDTLYVGAVCSAESTQDASQIEAYVWAYDGTGFSEVLVADFPAYRGGQDYKAWNPWSSDVDTTTVTEYPQAMLTDIDFTNGDMLLGFRDRYGDQTPGNGLRPDDAPFPRGHGDILRAGANGDGTYTLNSEYYPDEISGGALTADDESTSGALAVNTATDEVITTAYDAVNRDETGREVYRNFNTGGVQIYNEAGAQTGAYDVYLSTYQDTMGKTNGLGDLEYVCLAAPIEIGNYVWLDTNANGLQDPDETALAGVEVSLMSGTDVLATAITDENGNYIFSSRAATSTDSLVYNLDLQAGSDYDLMIGLAQTPLDGLIVTQENVSTDENDMIDSDGILDGGVLMASATNVQPGADHTFDFGFTGGGFGGVEEFGSVGTVLFLDKNNDGVYNDGDESLEGINVELWQDTDGDCAPDVLMDSTTTDASGEYLFDQLLLNANYVVRVNDDSVEGYLNTRGDLDTDGHSQDANGYCLTLTTETPDVVTADFGYYAPEAQGGAAPEEPVTGDAAPEAPTGGAGLIRTGGDVALQSAPYLLAALATLSVLGTYLYKSR